MRTHLFCIVTIFVLAPRYALGQGTFVYDQQSADENTPGEAAVGIQSNQPFGQSFTPSLSAVGFIRLQLIGPPANSGTLAVNLRANSIIGTILGSTDPVLLPSGFNGYANFFFSTPIPVTPGVVYYFRPEVQSVDSWRIGAYNPLYDYPGGTEIYQGSPLPNSDLWFREGIVVPEPGTWGLLVIGCCLLVWRRRLFP